MQKFADQAPAVAIADEVLKALMTQGPADPPAPDEPPDRRVHRPLTGRVIFRGLSGHLPDNEPGSQSGASA